MPTIDSQAISSVATPWSRPDVPTRRPRLDDHDVAAHVAGRAVSGLTTDTDEATAFVAFQRAFPSFDSTRKLDDLRRREFARLDRLGQTYLDFTGGGLYAESQLRDHLDPLARGLFGNPHSFNPASLRSSELIDRTRAAILRFFNTTTADYEVVFTQNASGALRLVGEAYPFEPGGRLLLTADNHNSVNGLRQFARSGGAAVDYLPITSADLRIDDDAVISDLDGVDGNHPRLFAFPAQSNFSGVQHPLTWIDEAQRRGWEVLLDAAALVPTNRLDLSRWRPDFVAISFYKMFGYPTGIGCLLVRPPARRRLRRPWFAGGTVSMVSVQRSDSHRLADDAIAFQDGTVDYLSIPAIEIGLRLLDEIGLATIHERVACLTGWLLAALHELRHQSGAPMVDIYGPTTLADRGGTIAFNLHAPDGRVHDYRRIEAAAAAAGISLRTGCFCNPGAGEAAHRIPPALTDRCFNGPTPPTLTMLAELRQRHRPDGTAGAVRVSVGSITTFADAYRLVRFLRRYLDLPAAAIAPTVADPAP